MKTKAIIIIGILLALVAFILPRHYFLGKPSCSNSDTFFETNDPNEEIYQVKLRAVLKTSDPDDFRYFFITFIENEDYMMVNMRNRSHCFDAKILVRDWSKLGGMRKLNGVSYPEELYYLSWEIVPVEGNEEIVYLDMHSIID